MKMLPRLPRVLLPTAVAAAALLAGVRLLAPAPVRAAGPTDVPGGTISTNTTWTLADSPYIVLGGVYVGAGATLTIEPGVEVRFNAGTWLSPQSGGTLLAEGTAGQPIVFTSNAASPGPGDWRYLYFYDGSRVRLSHCSVRYAGGGTAGGSLELHGPDVEIRNCRIHDGGDNGLYLHPQAVGGLIADTQIENHALQAMYVERIGHMPALSNVSLSGNGEDLIYLDSGEVVGQAILDGSPEAINGAYYTTRSVAVGAGDTLTIVPGTELRILESTGTNNLSVNEPGVLIAEGAPGRPITFTSANGAMNPAGWSGLDLTGDVTARLAHCNIAYAASAGIHVSAAFDVPDIQVRHCRIHHGNNDGVFIFGIENDMVIADTRIDHNAGTALRISGPRALPEIQNLTLDNNGLDAVWFNGSGAEFPAGQHATLDGGPHGTNGAPFIFANTSYVLRDGASLTVKPGTEVRFNPGVSLDFNAGTALWAEGTAANPITFTSNLTTPVPGSWGRLLLRSGSTLRLAHCAIAYGGSAGSSYVLDLSTSDA
jgi:hypothetical protein